MTATAVTAPPEVKDASADEVRATLERLRATFASGKTRPAAWRKDQLRAIRALCKENEERLLQALHQDLRKSPLEAYAGEVGYLSAEASHALKHLDKWMRPEKVWTPMVNFKATSYVRFEPLGVALIVGPWNYPLQLVQAPLIGAVSAGDCAVLKPSELTPYTSALIAELVPRYLDPDAVAVVEGGVPTSQALLAERFDHVFFTGSTAVGRIVAQAAAKHLTPVTLELGGKSPCIVDRRVDVEVAARRIVWGKFFNAGQTCVAPDYLLVDRSVEEPLLDALTRTIRSFYGEDPQQSPDFARIVNAAHHERLSKLIPQGEAEGEGQVVTGGRTDPTDRYIDPTVVRGVSPDAPLMRDEIFGPLLPVVTTSGLDEAVEFVNARDKPLALYVFSSDADAQRKAVERTSSGGVCVNDTMSHLAVPELPFGGVGASGMGAYHGRYSFLTFSHRRSVLERSTWIDLKLRYPPYEGALDWVKKLLG